jgi:hypothetical protein
MEEIIAKLRYFPLEPVSATPVPIIKSDLDKIAQTTGVQVSLHTITAKNQVVDGDVIREETMDSTIEDVSQTVITASSQDEASFRKAIRELINLYRAPRTVYGTWGSTEKGALIVSELCDENDGWY